MTDQVKLNCSLENSKVLLYDGVISEADEVVNLMEACAGSNTPLTIIAHDVNGEALAMLVVNSARKVMRALAVKAPGFGDERSEILKDMAALTGTKVITPGMGMELEDVTITDLGEADRVISDKLKTSLIGGAGNKSEIEARVDIIRKTKEKSDSDYERERLEKRLAKISGGAAVIKVGAESEIEMKEKKDRVDDAILSTKAALEEGIVPGGGVALIHSQNGLVIDETLSLDKQKGIQIVYSACSAPFRKIVENAGLNADSLLERLLKSTDVRIGYNVITEEFGDLVEAGVVDPTKVTRTAIEKAVSVAGTLLTTEAMIVNDDDDDNTTNN